MDNKNSNTNKTNLFIRDIAKYFMDFLESDFHKHRKPNRKIQYKGKNNLLVGQKLDNYPTFQKLVTDTILDGFDKKGVKKISKNVYTRNIPQTLMSLVERLISQLAHEEILQLIEDIVVIIEQSISKYEDDIYQIEEDVIENIKLLIKKNLVLPFVKNLEVPLSSLSFDDENQLFIIEEELTNNMYQLLEESIPEAIDKFIEKQGELNKESLIEQFTLQNISSIFLSFFESMHTADLFQDISEMYRNLQILEKQEFYLYFYDITYQNTTYPIFYIPFNLIEINSGKTYKFEFDSQVYINKKVLEFLVQEYNSDNPSSKGVLKEITDRIIYLADFKECFDEKIALILNEIISFFKLNKEIDIYDSISQTSKSLSVSISNSSYISIFDKSDEALVNDYEDILELLKEDNNKLSDAFKSIIEDFFYNNPEPFEEDVEQEWDDTLPHDKLIFQSPIPLNSEQRQIVNALKKEGCKYVAVEGPPGTGKSHTITAIVFNAILKEQSVLVLSDKKEALDVVEDKISSTMNKARPQGDFQNPILRLGKTGNNYKQLLSRSAIEKIKTYHKAVKKHNGQLETDILKIEKTLKEDFEAEELSYSDIDINKIKRYYNLQKLTDDWNRYVDTEELQNINGSAEQLESIRDSLFDLNQTLFSSDSNKTINFCNSLHISPKDYQSLESWKSIKNEIQQIIDVSNKVLEIYPQLASQMVLLDSFSDEDFQKLNTFINDYKALKSPYFGYLFKKKDLAIIDLKFRKKLNISTDISPSKQLHNWEKLIEIFTYLDELTTETIEENQLDAFTIAHYIFTYDNSIKDINSKLLHKIDDLDKVFQNLESLPNNWEKIDIDSQNLKTLQLSNFLDFDDTSFNKLLKFITLKEELINGFSRIPSYNYILLKQQLENLVTTKMTYLMDKRVIDFDRNYKADRKALGKIIQSKQKFPKEEFLKLKNAFPCILAGIRDYAEYIPLESNIFDLVIIDEASQVSIAQAFPALLRAKKVLVLGDRKQFPNIKSAQAKGVTNQRYINKLEKSFRDNISNDNKYLVKLKNFNIKTSILDFFDSINNYNALLKKHFRGYKEIIAYSNKFFYENDLQVMKIRGKSINEVLKFTYIENPQPEGLISNINISEIHKIIQELEELQETDSNQSVGIITPHTNQRKLLMEEINKHSMRDFFFEKLKLKIMTFDTCQGEERDIIFYSMVATLEKDSLSNIFIKDLATAPEGSIRKSRLNVGFSRAKETMHFMLSKPLEEYRGSIGNALRFYSQKLEQAQKEPLPDEVDENSPMEKKVLHWLTQTKFWIQNFPNKLHLKPQFEIGKYLKQLDSTYDHPKYVADFLMIYKDEDNYSHQIIVEYDGFKEHFNQVDEVNEFNYSHYYSADDVYRQKILESYGYKFLRINKFNLGENPIETLDKRIPELVKNSLPNNFLNQVQDDLEAIEAGEIKECPKCGEVKDLSEFRDDSLVHGVGRFCNKCKGIEIGSNKNQLEFGTILCPKCSSKMAVRTGKYGRFHGCTRYPVCRGTRQV